MICWAVVEIEPTDEQFRDRVVFFAPIDAGLARISTAQF
jgi:hypothetical protein